MEEILEKDVNISTFKCLEDAINYNNNKICGSITWNSFVKSFPHICKEYQQTMMSLREQLIEKYKNVMGKEIDLLIKEENLKDILNNLDEKKLLIEQKLSNHPNDLNHNLSTKKIIDYKICKILEKERSNLLNELYDIKENRIDIENEMNYKKNELKLKLKL
ncbi:unnamed protein product [Gordionus sp. m RMFG-2023]